MQRLPSRKRRLIALVVALLALSALLGDTSTTRQASAEPVAVLAIDPLSCGSSAPGPRAAATDGERSAGLAPLVQQGPGTSPRALAGVPPWTIWPPAPVPRIGRAVVQSPPVRTRTVVPLLCSRLPSSPESAAIFSAGKWGHSAQLAEPAPLRERVGGVDLASPRPPPH
jgi:hypothetical protein